MTAPFVHLVRRTSKACLHISQIPLMLLLILSSAVYETPMMHMGSVILDCTSVVEVRGGTRGREEGRKFFPRCESRFSFHCESYKLCRFCCGIIISGTEPGITEFRVKLSLSSHSDTPLTLLYALRMNSTYILFLLKMFCVSVCAQPAPACKSSQCVCSSDSGLCYAHMLSSGPKCSQTEPGGGPQLHVRLIFTVMDVCSWLAVQQSPAGP